MPIKFKSPINNFNTPVLGFGFYLCKGRLCLWILFWDTQYTIDPIRKKTFLKNGYAQSHVCYTLVWVKEDTRPVMLDQYNASIMQHFSNKSSWWFCKKAFFKITNPSVLQCIRAFLKSRVYYVLPHVKYFIRKRVFVT